MLFEDYDLGRYELKYAVPASCRDQIIEMASDFTRPDKWGRPLGNWPGATGYIVHSLYFDTPDLDDFSDRLAERKVRDRLRIRTYGAAGEGQPLFLENKKKYMDRVIKHRVHLCTADEWCLSPDGKPWRHFESEVNDAKRFVYRNFANALERGGRGAMALVRYEREVFVGTSIDDPKVRLTFDHNLRGKRVNDAREIYARSVYDLIPRDYMVVEMKFDRIKPGWMREISSALRARAEPVSKFGLSMVIGHRSDRPSEIRYLTPHSIRKAERAR